MKLLDSLLDAIVRLEGDALVMHVGEKPYVVTTSAAMSVYRGPLAWGQVELSSRVLTVDAVHSMLAQILPPDQCRALDEVGAIEQEIGAPAGSSDRFTVVAARGGDDIWLELRRQPAPVESRPAEAPEPALVAEAEVASVSATGAAAQEVAISGQDDVRSQGSEPVPLQAIEGTGDERMDEGGRSAEAAAVSPEQPEEIQERVPVLDEVGQHEPEHVEHVVISVSGRDGREDVPLDSVPNDAFEVVDDVTQEAPSDSEVDAMLAATAAALLNSGMGADVQTVEEDVPLDSTPLEVDESVDAVADQPNDQPGVSWTELGIGDIAATTPAAAIADAADTSVPPPDSRAAEEPVPHAEVHAIEVAATDLPEPAHHAAVESSAAEAEDSAAAEAPAAEATPPQSLDETAASIPDVPMAVGEAVEEAAEEKPVAAASAAHVPEPVIPEAAAAASALPPAFTIEPRIPVSETLPELHGHGAHAPASHHDTHGHADARHGVVVPLARGAARTDGVAGGITATLQSALRTAGARGANTVYLVAQSKPVIRANGEIIVLEDEPVLGVSDIQALVAALTPPQRPHGEELEWMCDVAGIGRVRCLTFSDHRGPGVIFRVDHAGLPAEVRALCAQPDGLVVLAGPHASGKTTLLNAFVDQVNVTRGDHVITLESRVGFVHESRKSFISQREQGDDAGRAAAAARAALREDPDVLVIEDLRFAELTAVALEAAESGRLVFATVSAPSAVPALQQLLESFPADRRGRAARSLASALRGVVSQVLVRRTGGGRMPVREVLINTPTVASMIRDGRTGELPTVFESGRAQGIVSMTDALVSLVRDGSVQAAEAYRKAGDRTTLLARLKQEGVDTTFADRLV